MEHLYQQIREINQLTNENDLIYHKIARRYGLSDSVFWLLYIIFNSNEPSSQSALCEQWHYSKQTIQSAIAALVNRKLILLRKVEGSRNRKHIVLTKQGEAFCQRVICEVNAIEREAYSGLTDEQRARFLNAFRVLNQKLKQAYQNQYHSNSEILKEAPQS